jgi:hypothetical protein
MTEEKTEEKTEENTEEFFEERTFKDGKPVTPPTKTYSDAQMLYDRIQSLEAEMMTLKRELNPAAFTESVLQAINSQLQPVFQGIDLRIKHLEAGGIREDLVEHIANKIAEKLKEE